jgi:hypothetical protein
MKCLPPIILFLGLLPTVLLSQSYSADLSKSKITIAGTSSLHDWESTVEQLQLSATVDASGSITIDGSVPVKSIKSGKSIMDGKTYDALNADEFAEIMIKGTQLNIEENQVTGEVQVTIKGISNTYKVQSSGTITDNTFQVNGSIDIDMTSFDIEPPTAMFGSLTTGKDVVINYQILLKK